jgi:hypothetical protein
VTNSISLIFRFRLITKVGKPIVGWLAVLVSHFVTIWRWSVKSEHDKDVDRLGFSLAAIMEGNLGIRTSGGRL